MWNWFLQLSDDNKIKVLGLLGAIVTFCIAIYRYMISQKWKKTEFLANEYKNFIDDPYVIKASIILDNYKIDIPFSTVESDKTKTHIEFNPDKLKAALKAVEDETKRPNDEVYIRLCLDRFFLKLGVFENYISQKIITENQAYGYLSYWINLIGGTRYSNDVMSPEIRELLVEFIRKDYYSSTKKLFERFKHLIDKKQASPSYKSPDTVAGVQ